MVEAIDTVFLVALSVGALLAWLITGASYRAYRTTRAAPLRRFAIGFLLLTLAQLAALLLEITTLRADVIPEEGFDHFDALFWLYHGAFVLGLVAIFSSFGRHPFRWAPALGPLLLKAGPVLQLLEAVILFFVVLHAGLNHIARARAGSLQTAVGFFLLLLSQFLFLFQAGEPLSPRGLWGELAAVAGYLTLYVALVRPQGTR